MSFHSRVFVRCSVCAALWCMLPVLACDSGSPDPVDTGKGGGTAPRTIQWSPAGGVEAAFVTAVVADDGGAVFAGTYGGGLYRSSDYGMSWDLIGMQGEEVSDIDMATGGVLYVATDGGTYRSSDGGDHWSQVADRTWSLATAADGTVVRVNADGVESSSDGMSWTDITGTLTPQTDVDAVVISAGNMIYGRGTTGVWRRPLHGGGWNAVNAGLSGGGFRKIWASPDTAIVFTDDFAGLMRTTDADTAWTRVRGQVQSFAFLPAGNMVAGTDYYGTVFSNDGGFTWSGLQTSAPWLEALAYQAGSLIAGTRGCGVMKAQFNQNNFYRSDAGIASASVGALAMTGSVLLAGCERGGMFYSNDGGDTWNPSSAVTDCESGTGPMVVDSQGRVYVGLGSNVARSSDGWNWETFPAGLTTVASLAVGLNDTLFAGGSSGGIAVSGDGGQIWIPTGFTHDFVYGIAVDASGTVYCTGAGIGVQKSGDSGATWIPLGQETLPWYTIAVDESGAIYVGGFSVSRLSSGGTWNNVSGGQFGGVTELMFDGHGVLFACTNDGVFTSEDAGLNWVRHDDGLTDPYANTLTFASDGTVFLGTRGAGVFRGQW